MKLKDKKRLRWEEATPKRIASILEQLHLKGTVRISDLKEYKGVESTATKKKSLVSLIHHMLDNCYILAAVKLPEYSAYVSTHIISAESYREYVRITQHGKNYLYSNIEQESLIYNKG